MSRRPSQLLLFLFISSCSSVIYCCNIYFYFFYFWLFYLLKLLASLFFDFDGFGYIYKIFSFYFLDFYLLILWLFSELFLNNSVWIGAGKLYFFRFDMAAGVDDTLTKSTNLSFLILSRTYLWNPASNRGCLATYLVVYFGVGALIIGSGLGIVTIFESLWRSVMISEWSLRAADLTLHTPSYL